MRLEGIDSACDSTSNSENVFRAPAQKVFQAPVAATSLTKHCCNALSEMPLRNPYKHKRFCAITSITPVGRWTRALDISIPHCIPLFCLFCCVLFALVCAFVSGDAYVLAYRYPYAWTVNFEMGLEGIHSACDSACNSERISVSTSERISAGADDSNCMSAINSVDIHIICQRSKSAHFSLRTPYQNLNFLAPEHQMPIWV